MKLTTPLDANRKELRNAVTQNLATAPATPVAGLRYYDTALKTERYWNGTAWVDVGAQLIQSVTAVILTTDASGFVVIAFPIAYAVAPTVIVSHETPGIPAMLTVQWNLITSTSFAVQCYRPAGTTYASVSLAFGWVSVGPRP